MIDIVNKLPDPATRYADYTEPVSLSEAIRKEKALIYVEIRSTMQSEQMLMAYAIDLLNKSRKPATVKIKFFRFYKYHLFHISEGSRLYLYGKVLKNNGTYQIIHPRIVSRSLIGYIVPEKKLSPALQNDILNIKEYLDEKTLRDFNLIPLHTALQALYMPSIYKDKKSALDRIAVEEIVNLLVSLKKYKSKNYCLPKLDIKETEKFPEQFFKLLNFSPTEDQYLAVSRIFSSIIEKRLLNHIITGDVGTGKTVVAASALWLASIAGGRDSFFVTPSVVLAHQHYQTLSLLFGKEKVKLYTSNVKETGPLGTIYVGTHALMNLDINPYLTVIDEQHLFGVVQREFLRKNSGLIQITATPIPHTFIQILNGIMEVIHIKQAPHHRNVITRVVDRSATSFILNKIKEFLNRNEKVLVIYPFIESFSQHYRSIKKTEQFWKKFYNRTVFLHGNMNDREKIEAVEIFKSSSNLLISTSIAESGLDIKNLSLLVVVNAERFGLSRLHQMRGRVGRQGQPSECYFITSDSEAAKKINCLETVNDGMEISYLDSIMRGPGDIMGVEQSGRFMRFFDLALHEHLLPLISELVNTLSE